MEFSDLIRSEAGSYPASNIVPNPHNNIGTLETQLPTQPDCTEAGMQVDYCPGAALNTHQPSDCAQQRLGPGLQGSKRVRKKVASTSLHILISASFASAPVP